MTLKDQADLARVVTAGVEPLKELVTRLLTVAEQLADRVELLEWEVRRRPPVTRH
jgi:hypothetical protein